MEPDKKRNKRSRRADSATVCSTTMNDQIWKELPEDLLERVIARLPIFTIFRFRLVCREWNSLIKSHRFLQDNDDKPLFYSRTYGKEDAEAIYDSYTKTWRYYSTCTQAIFPLASVGGLVCFSAVSRKGFIVVNPVTQTWKEFPWSHGRFLALHTAVGMVLHSGGYKIVALQTGGKFEVYDTSICPSQSTKGSIPENFILKYFPASQRCTPPVTIGTVVNFLTESPQGILSYDTVSGAWEQFHIPAPLDSTDISLAKCGGRILLVGLVRENNNDVSVRVWELQKKTMLAWTEVDRMRKSWCSPLSGRKEVRFMCIGNTGVLMMVLLTGRVNWMFTYDVVNREWSKVPRFILPDGRRWLQRISCGIVFFPSLSIAP